MGYQQNLTNISTENSPLKGRFFSLDIDIILFSLNNYSFKTFVLRILIKHKRRKLDFFLGSQPILGEIIWQMKEMIGEHIFFLNLKFVKRCDVFTSIF